MKLYEISLDVADLNSNFASGSFFVGLVAIGNSKGKPNPGAILIAFLWLVFIILFRPSARVLQRERAG